MATKDGEIIQRLDAIQRKLDMLIDSLDEALEGDELDEGTLDLACEKNLELITTLYCLNAVLKQMKQI